MVEYVSAGASDCFITCGVMPDYSISPSKREVIAVKLNKRFNSTRRVLPDSIILIILLVMLMSGFYKFLPGPLQVLISKIILVSTGFIHAHITRKVAFPEVDWNDSNDDKMKKALVIAIYVIFIYAYAQGG
jgi:hypothetical protein